MAASPLKGILSGYLEAFPTRTMALYLNDRLQSSFHISSLLLLRIDPGSAPSHVAVLASLQAPSCPCSTELSELSGSI